jgi:hypothetical protein
MSLRWYVLITWKLFYLIIAGNFLLSLCIWIVLLTHFTSYLLDSWLERLFMLASCCGHLIPICFSLICTLHSVHNSWVNQSVYCILCWFILIGWLCHHIVLILISLLQVSIHFIILPVSFCFVDFTFLLGCFGCIWENFLFFMECSIVF